MENLNNYALNLAAVSTHKKFDKTEALRLLWEPGPSTNLLLFYEKQPIAFDLFDL